MTLIFSKNRAMQLDALLQSMQKYYTLDDCWVLYVDDYGLYDSLKYEYQDVWCWHVQTNFKKDTEWIISESKQITFLCDDDIFYRNVIAPPSLKPFHTWSTRLGKNVSPPMHHCYNVSLDGNIFNTKDILPLMQGIQYKNPNKLEAYLTPFHEKFTMSWNRQCLVGIPHNKVSTTSNCWDTGKYSVKELNERFRNGERIDIEAMDYENITDVHSDINLVFKTQV